MDDAEAFRVAEGPFEVVEEGPDEVAADVGAFGDCVRDGADVLAEVVDAQRIVDDTVESGRRIVERGAVFGDVDRRRAVAVAEPEQDVGQRRRVNFPSRLGVDRLRLADARGALDDLRGIVLRHARAGSS